MNPATPWLGLAVVALMAGSFGVGWHAKGVSIDAGKAKSAQSETKAVVADVKQQATAQHATAVVEQGKTLGVAVEQSKIRDRESATKQEIEHATFQPARPSPAAVACPDPGATPEFVRLYNAAARGEPAVAGSATTR